MSDRISRDDGGERANTRHFDKTRRKSWNARAETDVNLLWEMSNNNVGLLVTNKEGAAFFVHIQSKSDLTTYIRQVNTRVIVRIDVLPATEEEIQLSSRGTDVSAGAREPDQPRGSKRSRGRSVTLMRTSLRLSNFQLEVIISKCGLKDGQFVHDRRWNIYDKSQLPVARFEWLFDLGSLPIFGCTHEHTGAQKGLLLATSRKITRRTDVEFTES